MRLDNDKIFPSHYHRKWLAAQAHVVDREDVYAEIEVSEALQGRKYKRPDISNLGTKAAYTEIMEEHMENKINIENVAEDFLNEKALQYHEIGNAEKKNKTMDALESNFDKVQKDLESGLDDR